MKKYLNALYNSALQRRKKLKTRLPLLQQFMGILVKKPFFEQGIIKAFMIFGAFF